MKINYYRLDLGIPISTELILTCNLWPPDSAQVLLQELDNYYYLELFFLFVN